MMISIHALTVLPVVPLVQTTVLQRSSSLIGCKLCRSFEKSDFRKGFNVRCSLCVFSPFFLERGCNGVVVVQSERRIE